MMIQEIGFFKSSQFTKVGILTSQTSRAATDGRSYSLGNKSVQDESNAHHQDNSEPVDGIPAKVVIHYSILRAGRSFAGFILLVKVSRSSSGVGVGRMVY